MVARRYVTCEILVNGITAKFQQGVEMNRIVRLAVIFGCAVIPMATVSAKVKVSEVTPPSNTILLDFGNNQSYRGANTPSPDRKGNFWNSVWAGALTSP